MTENQGVILVEELRRRVEELLSSDAFTEEEKLSLIREVKTLLALDVSDKNG